MLMPPNHLHVFCFSKMGFSPCLSVAVTFNYSSVSYTYISYILTWSHIIWCFNKQTKTNLLQFNCHFNFHTFFLAQCDVSWHEWWSVLLTQCFWKNTYINLNILKFSTLIQRIILSPSLISYHVINLSHILVYYIFFSQEVDWLFGCLKIKLLCEMIRRL